ncbi:hypothetical protein [Streptomyces sp. NPDC096339]|uniref:hypothetical protein n=1 Tax=Streptomyces sp. NPDC096339 TaxID=3366086 RepID=UPI00381AFF35
MKLGNSLRTLAAAGLVLGAVAVGAGPASAVEKDGVLGPGELGLYCYGNQQDAVFDLYYRDDNFANDVFKGARICSGQTPNDNTESYLSKDTYIWDVYTDWKRLGYSTSIYPGERAGLTPTYFNQLSSAYPR